MYNVVLSDHAKERLIERAGPSAIRGARAEITTRLIATLRLGAVPDRELGVTVHLPDGYRAVCCPTFEGTWVVATVLPPKEFEIVTEDRAPVPWPAPIEQQRGVS